MQQAFSLFGFGAFGGAFRAGVRAEQPLDVAARSPYGLYRADIAYAHRVVAVEDARCGSVARRVDGYHNGYGRSEHNGHSADSLLPSPTALCAGWSILHIEGGGCAVG